MTEQGAFLDGLDTNDAAPRGHRGAAAAASARYLGG